MRTNADKIARIRHTLDVLFVPGDVVELRVLGTERAGTVSGYYDDLDRLAQDAVRWDGHAPAVYVTLNPCKLEVLCRARNRFRTFSKKGDLTTDDDILKRRWLPVDFDAVRPSGISSTDKEHFAAIARAQCVRSALALEDWPEPIVADSGNGGHLLYHLDLPNDDATTKRIRAVLATIKKRFSTEAVSIDTTVSNAARLWKLYGTEVRKGDSTPERPHRLSQILELPVENA